MDKTYLIIGASGGIGGALLQQYLARHDDVFIHATSRAPAESVDPRLEWHSLDYLNEASTIRLVRELHLLGEPLDGFICATGALTNDTLPGPEKRLADVRADVLTRSYTVNAAGPLALFAQCAPLLKKASAPKIVFLSAQVGSIGDNRAGGWHAYRMAKAALNMGVVGAATEAQRWRNEATVLAVHPGTTHTGLSKPFTRRREAPVREPVETAAHLHCLIEHATPEMSGQFVTATGQALPW